MNDWAGGLAPGPPLGGWADPAEALGFSPPHPKPTASTRKPHREGGPSATAPADQAVGARRRELERLYDAHHESLFVCALAVTRCPDLAEDAVHDVFSRLLARSDEPRDLKVYVYRSVRNAAIDLVRKSGRTVELVDDLLFDPAPDPRRSAESAEFHGRVAEALATLSEDERETIIQHLYADLTFREIAELRELSINTVMSWYRRGLVKLRARLEE